MEGLDDGVFFSWEIQKSSHKRSWKRGGGARKEGIPDQKMHYRLG
jgi:hypothetical protein